MPAFISADIEKLSPEKPAVVGFAIVGHPNIKYASPALVCADADVSDPLEIHLKFLSGSLELVRTEIHNRIDEAIDALHEQWS